MAENIKRPGQPGEDDRNRNLVSPERAPQGASTGAKSGGTGTREDLGRGQTGKPGENLGSERGRTGIDTAAATPVTEEIGLAGDADPSTDSVRAGSGGGNARQTPGGSAGNGAGNNTGSNAGGNAGENNAPSRAGGNAKPGGAPANVDAPDETTSTKR